jgi:hypothetical protein
MTEYGRSRALHLRKMIDEHRPKAVILYSLSDEFQPLWRLISGFDFAETELPYTTYAVRDEILYLIIPHPDLGSRLHLSAPTFFREVGHFVTARLRGDPYTGGIPNEVPARKSTAPPAPKAKHADYNYDFSERSVITLLRTSNPKRIRTQAHSWWEKYSNGVTVGQLLNRGVSRRDMPGIMRMLLLA